MSPLYRAIKCIMMMKVSQTMVGGISLEFRQIPHNTIHTPLIPFTLLCNIPSISFINLADNNIVFLWIEGFETLNRSDSLSKYVFGHLA